jgi:hypothetical protein
MSHTGLSPSLGFDDHVLARSDEVIEWRREFNAGLMRALDNPPPVQRGQALARIARPALGLSPNSHPVLR